MFNRDMILHELSYYTATALPNTFRYSEKWSKIANNLFLGKIPLRGGDKDEILKVIQENGDAPLGLVVSVVKPPEINQKYYTMDPIRPEEWKADGTIDHYNLQMADFTAEVNIREAAKLVIDIQEKYRSKNKSVLIHCKAGKSRSAMLTCCVLVMFDLPADENNKDKPLEELVEIAAREIKYHRKQVSISAALKRTAVLVVNEAMMLLKINSIDEEKVPAKKALSLKERADECFADSAIKDEIKHMKIYNSISKYKDELNKNIIWRFPVQGKPERVKHIEKLLKSIDEANDSSWYESLVKMEGPAKELLDASPIMNVTDAAQDKVEREDLIEKLKNDIESLICLNLSCEKSEFRELFSTNEEKLIVHI